MKNYKNFSNEDWALYIAKVYDLDADEMEDVAKLLEEDNIKEVLKTYGRKLDAEAKKILKQNFSGTPIFEYFEIKNTVDEWSSASSGMYTTLDAAKEALKDCCDWYAPKGTGTIYRVWFTGKANGAIYEHREEVYRHRFFNEIR